MKNPLILASSLFTKLALLTIICIPAMAETINAGRSDVQLFVPAGYSGVTKTPLVILLHGYTGSGSSIENYLGFGELVDVHKFFLLTPDGTQGNGFSNRYWNATAACCWFEGPFVDDSTYLANLITEMKFNYNVDENRIFLIGYSNGGFMAHRMAYDHPETIAAIASLAGATPLEMSRPTPKNLVSILQIHGTADDTILYNGGSILGVAYPSANDSLEKWAAHNGLALNKTELQEGLNLDRIIPGDETKVTQYDESGAVELWTIQDASHEPSFTADFKRNVIKWLLDHPKIAAAQDFDQDGFEDNIDADDDNDGVLDIDDAFPLDAAESRDTDSDGIGNNADSDDDNDGVTDSADIFPLDSSESLDTDDDAIGNNADTDDDNDGIADVNDAFPLDTTNTPLITARLFNIATRGFIGTGENVLIGGVIISGAENKTVIIRAKGPSLAGAGVSGVLPDPQMVLFSGATQINSNDDWELHENMNLVPDNLKPTNSSEAVIVTTLAPGAYTVIVNGVNNEEGIGIIEVFELDDTGSTRIVNIATRGFVGTNDNVLIAGLIVTGTGAGKVIIRAKGPSLTSLGVAGVLADPKITLLQGSTAIDSNDNWQDHAEVTNIPNNLKPDNDLEAAIYKELAPGAYTAIVEGVGGATGVGIVEVFAVQ
ncbi:MAG: polyhydroxybutyrate depolymerase [Gammaproteobacteria bacterium]|jgi:polyhydroxybutyrate depolymerase